MAKADLWSGMTALPGQCMAHATQAGLKDRGLWAVASAGSESARVVGPPGVFNVFLSTELWVGDGMLRAECSVPVLIPRDRIEAVLELCLELSGQGRVGFAVGRRGTPIATTTVLIPDTDQELAQRLCGTALETLWLRASGAEPLLAAVAAGSDPSTVYSEDIPGPSIGPGEFPAPFHGRPRQGAAWNDVPRVPDGLAPDTQIPDGRTEAEMRVLAAVTPRLIGRTGLVNACPGPLVLHADATIECFGCTEPATFSHVADCILACSPDRYLGAGHRCERCETGT